MNALPVYLDQLNQEVLDRASVEEGGALLEEVATRYMLDLLQDTGYISDALLCHDAREDRSGRRIIHRISAYAINEGGSSLDLFITSFYRPGGPEEGVRTFGKADLEKSISQATRFLETAVKGYVDQVEDSAPVYALAYHLAKYGSELVRVRIFILTNGRASSPEGAAEKKQIGGIMVSYELWDIERFQRLSAGTADKGPIVIDFDVEHSHPIRCLPMPVATDDYQTWLAILPGSVLAELYERHGQRLLERNVRAFLQFSTKVNRGIQETVMKTPERFLAYNNGLAATAARVELTEDGSAIRRIHDLQIVNGGQTTASIYQLHYQSKGAAPLDKVFVQMKLTVLSEAHDTDRFAALIAQYANTQNQIKQADLSANEPFNVALQRISRSTWAPALSGTGKQQRWFFERARGQYRVERARTMTKANMKRFDSDNPRNKLITKELVAKCRLAWEQNPHKVAMGGEKAYAAFRERVEEGQLPNNAWFEDLVAVAILWKEADAAYTAAKRKGTKFLAVPYTLAWLSHVTGEVDVEGSVMTRLDLPGIWRRQSLTVAQSQLIHTVVPLIDEFILTASVGRLPSEWAKKSESWEDVVSQGTFGLNMELAAVRAELLSAGSIETRYVSAEVAELV
ncbi:AIPR family protein [Hymenobacter sp. AT01-02]|uniref:AIPR family protein n=1 Tax=Hymenobacter sp. AT01-02 TaxID=1571877 RepID=UPI0005F0D61B|nr:AIPR family protein [Hymenobacter sp. AT01-02]